MHRFYVNENQINDNIITISGQDVNHIKNVLRMKPGEEIVICNGQGKDYYCIITSVCDNSVTTNINSIQDTSTELPVKISLFQGLPKADKMELIIQKAVELGAYELIPVNMARSVVKYSDAKKEAKKLQRWQAISESAAKQAGRGIIPKILPIMSYKEAISYGKNLDLTVLAYENAKGIKETKNYLNRLRSCNNAGIIIGPEGGFEGFELDLAKENNINPISLGRRILRTETASLAILSMALLYMEE